MSETTYGSEQATAASTTTLRTPDAPATTYASLVRDTGQLRDRAQLTQADIVELHQTSQLGLLDERAAIVALQDTSDLLEALASEGLSWTTIARLVGVSDTAVRKWRRGEAVAAESRRKLARVVAFLEILSQYAVAEVGSWLEMRISEDAVTTPIDLYGAGRADLLFELAGRRWTPYRVLDAFDPDWRSRQAADTQFTVTDGPDGERVIVERRTSD